MIDMFEIFSKLPKMCHEINRTICKVYGDDSQKSWEDAPEWQVKATYNLILEIGQCLINGKPPSSKETHEKWVEDKLRDGWKYGIEKNADMKTHPLLVPFEELPFKERLKDTMIKMVILAYYEELTKGRK